jgi:hypothetical protein
MTQTIRPTKAEADEAARLFYAPTSTARRLPDPTEAEVQEAERVLYGPYARTIPAAAESAPKSATLPEPSVTQDGQATYPR